MRQFLLSALALTGMVPPASCQRPEPPRLVVVLTVDQLIPAYLERFGPQLSGGLARIARSGAYYPNGLQDHAATETAPGHSTILSGRSPASTGITANDFGVPDPGSPLVGARGPGASPARFRGTTLADWMLAADPQLQVLSVSRKDRGAILPVGRMNANVFWYAPADGIFTTSRWYGNQVPDWVVAWNARGGVRRLGNHVWDLLRPERDYPEPDLQEWERGGRGVTFPYQLPSDSTPLFSGITNMPWMDSLTMDLALDGVRALGMGRRNRPDLLAVSLSTTDAVGHAWGPLSREIHDQVLRLDHWLGWFLDSLETTVGRGRLLVALTSDHGIQPYPEGLIAAGKPAGRVALAPILREADSVIYVRTRTDFQFDSDIGMIFGNVSALQAWGVDTDSLSAAMAAKIARLPGVRRTFTPATLAAAPADDPEAALWRRRIPADFQWLAAGVLEQNYMWSSGTTTTSHGTTNLADRNVPIAFMGAGIAPQVSQRAARTIDIAPTLAALLGIRPLQGVEGSPLPEVVPPGR